MYAKKWTAWTTLIGLVILMIAVTFIVPAVFAQEQAEESQQENGRPTRHGQQDRGPRQGLLDIAAEELSLTRDELIAELEQDQSIADVATARGVAVDTIIDAAMVRAEERTQEAVADGRITQAEADERLAEHRERITTRVNEAGVPEAPEGRGSRGPRGPGGDAG